MMVLLCVALTLAGCGQSSGTTAGDTQSGGYLTPQEGAEKFRKEANEILAKKS